MAAAILLVTGSIPMSPLAAESEKSPVAIGSRVEMFVDDWLIDASRSRGGRRVHDATGDVQRQEFDFELRDFRSGQPSS